MKLRTELVAIHERLEERFGDLHWWPADDPFEVMVGAILTQNTAWTNVEKAIAALKKKGLLDPYKISGVSEAELAELIRPSGYYHLKTARLKALVKFFTEGYAGSVEEMQKEKLPVLREKLLGVWGVGPETADSILLYACEKPIFVIDAYTRRILTRHRLIPENLDYDEIQALFMQNLPPAVPLFKQYHALIVNTGKNFCRKQPDCSGCPLGALMERGSAEQVAR
jgi:endonuclease-3 related protein